MNAIICRDGFQTRLYTADGTLLLNHIECAHTFGLRLRGLLLRPSIAPDHGLWIKPCSSVHMIAMRFSIDVIFLDQELRIVKLAENLKPWRFAAAPAAASAIETAVGFIERHGLRVGQQLMIR